MNPLRHKTSFRPAGTVIAFFFLITACAPLSADRAEDIMPPSALMAAVSTPPAMPKAPLNVELAPLPSPEEPPAVLAADAPVAATPGVEEPKYDFPMAQNRYVDYHLDIFQHRDRKTFKLWLARAGRYNPMITAQLAKAGLPLDLTWLPLIESGYSLTAYSRARAVGPWQFLRSTARMYGLRVDNFVDERRDPVKATAAAIRFLKDLYEDLGDWSLAVAAYNGGIGRVGRAVKRARTKDFWELVRRRFLKRETRNYVPRLIAAIMIAKNPQTYGFNDITPYSPLEFESVDVPPWTSLRAVAVAGDIKFAVLKTLNRHLRRGITPPGPRPYPVRVPVGTATKIKENINRVYATVSTRFRTHVVKRRETIGRICRRYRISRTTLLKANDLTSRRLRIGQRLRIPFQHTTYKLSPVDLDRMRAEAGGNRDLILHRIKPGESVWSIARRYNIPPHLIVSWNNLKDPTRIKAGERLALFLGDLNKDTTRTTALIAKTVTASDISDNRSASATGGDPTYYRVRSGDTLWKIARHFQVTPEKIRQWNDIAGNTIYPGRLLVLKIAGDLDA